MREMEIDAVFRPQIVIFDAGNGLLHKRAIIHPTDEEIAVSFYVADNAGISVFLCQLTIVHYIGCKIEIE